MQEITTKPKTLLLCRWHMQQRTNLLHHNNKFSFKLYDPLVMPYPDNHRAPIRNNKNNFSPCALPIVTPSYFTEIWAASLSSSLLPSSQLPFPNPLGPCQPGRYCSLCVTGMATHPMLLNPNAPQIYVVTSPTTTSLRKLKKSIPPQL